jgi:type VI secretion system ImpM family protein
MENRMPNEYLTGYYGKLPISREFLRWNGAGAEVRELDPWMQEGMLSSKAHLGDAWAEALERAEIWNFLFFPERGSRPLLGVLIPSVDQVGREFPFLAFMLIDREKMTIRPALMPLAFNEFLQRTSALVARLRSAKEWNAFKTEFESLNWASRIEPRQVQASYEEQLSAVRVADFWAGVWGNGVDRPAIDICSALFDGTRRLTAANAPRSLALKFPLVRNEKIELYDVPFWIDLAASLEKGLGEPKVVFWTRGETSVSPCMLAGYATPSPKIVRFLLTPMADCPDWSDPFALWDRTGHDNQVGDHAPNEIACDPRASLRITLERIRSSTRLSPSRGSA